MVRRSSNYFESSVRHRARALQRELFDGLPDEEAIERVVVRPQDAGEPEAGSQPQTTFVDDVGRSFLFKLAPPDQIAAELFSFRVRRAAGRLHVPVARRTLDIPGQGRITGLLQPKIDVKGSLEPDPASWTPLQRDAILTEHPWEWLLANFDTHVDQYVLVGPHDFPVNIDWDHALVDLDDRPLTRFNMRSPAIAPVRNLLYSELVHGRLFLGLHELLHEARAAAQLPGAVLRRELDRYAETLSLPPNEHREKAELLQQRHQTIEGDFAALVASLLEERDAVCGGVNVGPRWRRVVHRAQDSWQRFATTMLYRDMMRPALKQYRQVLRAVGRRSG